MLARRDMASRLKLPGALATAATSVARLHLLVALSLLIGCGDDSNPAAPEGDGRDSNAGPAIRPLEEVTGPSGPPRMSGITTSDAVLLFESTIPLACSVIYGETTAYGLIATDQDMAGSAHVDHHPFTPGLKPDTEYHYRVQGTAADGTLYVSEDMTFRTPPADASSELNLLSAAAGARVTAVSSNFGGAANDQTWGADSAFDGSGGTAWSSNGDGNDAYIVVEMATPARLEAVSVWTRVMADGSSRTIEFTLTTDSGEVLGPFELRDAEQAYRFEIDVVTQTLRLDVVRSTRGNTGLVEFAAYGEQE